MGHPVAEPLRPASPRLQVFRGGSYVSVQSVIGTKPNEIKKTEAKELGFEIHFAVFLYAHKHVEKRKKTEYVRKRLRFLSYRSRLKIAAFAKLCSRENVSFIFHLLAV